MSNVIARLDTGIKKLILIFFCAYLILAPYEHKVTGKVCFAAGLSLWLLLNVLRYRFEFYRGFLVYNPLKYAFLVFGGISLLSIVFSADINSSQAVFFDRYLVYYFYFLMSVLLVTESKVNLYALSASLIISGLIFSLGGTWDYFYFHFLGNNPLLTVRLWSVFTKRIPYYGFPLYLTYFLPFTFFIFVFARNKIAKFILLINIILLSLCFIWNSSRASWVSVSMSLLILSLWCKKSKLLPFAISLAIALILLLTVFKSAMPDVKNRARTIFVPEEWSFRLPLYKQAISIIHDNPILGVGLGNYDTVVKDEKYKLSISYPVSPELNLHAHNTYLEVAAEMGIMGLLAFMGIFGAFFRTVLKNIGGVSLLFTVTEHGIFFGLLASILAILIFALSSTIITVGVNNSIYFWIMFGMATGMLARAEIQAKGEI